MKHEEVPEHFHSSYMRKVAEKLSILKMSAEEQANYWAYQKKIYNDRDELAAAESIGIAKGLAEGLGKGEAAAKITIAKNLLAQKIDLNTISTSTGLTIDELKKLDR